ncbi:glycosyltransferase family 4 protein [Prochlorococcus marinus]|uniref:Glycosyl transferase-like protein n=1 Tax=Prochlorococcus marinus XMU1408 TaxID=2213228 RepID=A0A318R6M8_PROMR|nr:glycosyltransferase family 4 protein [Prochlorococcus marinus]MBW3042876.1 glycosyl transferase-like protein [Prochlorococcus marinus str. XMU1408]PYE00702.1 glycosyl transferase-like protein [Prochlorococcus marinus XMU1408]
MISTIFYHPEAYSTSGSKLMGRNAAGESFLRGYLTHSNTDEFWVLVDDPKYAKEYLEKVLSFGRSEPVKAIFNNSLNALSESGLVFYPGPDISKYSFRRASLERHGSWSLCGITHTTSSIRAMDAIVDLISSPIYPWDCLICTSNASKANVENILQAQVDFLRNRLGITTFVLPQLPVIPLGIHTDDFVFTPFQKDSARKELQISSDAIVVLFMGRLSFHAKAHPLVMYQALEAAVQATNKNVVLVECGWHANEYIAKAFVEAAKTSCPNISVLNLDGRNKSNRDLAWASADIFCSFSDNIQETFGITPIEAMAAGLPVVVSDWDGYKDTVRDGIDGFRIPTTMPSAGLGNDLSYRHALGLDTYDMYCGKTSSLVAVDVKEATNAFIKLFDSPDLIRQMGKAGRKRAIDSYDWRVIISKYESLWLRLRDIRETHVKELKPLKYPWPARMDPFHSFSHYSTYNLSTDTLFSLLDNDLQVAMQRLDSYFKLDMVNFTKDILPSYDEIYQILKAVESAPQSALEIISRFPEKRQSFIFRSLTWFLKIGILMKLDQPNNFGNVVEDKLI